MSSPPIGTLVYISIKPLIKLAIPTLAGFSLVKAGLFPTAGTRAASQIILNITLPSLLFAKIVAAFTPQNIGSIGVIVLVAIFYEGISLIFGVLTRFVFPTARNFHYGIIAAAVWSNWGDLPTSVAQTITSNTPFGEPGQSDLAVAYVSIFILVFYVTLFPMKGVLFIQMDYTHPPPPLDGEGSGPGSGSATKTETLSSHWSSNAAYFSKVWKGFRTKVGGGRGGREGKLRSKQDSSSVRLEDGLVREDDEKMRSLGKKEKCEEGGSSDDKPIFPELTLKPSNRSTTSARSLNSLSMREAAGAATAAPVASKAATARRGFVVGRGSGSGGARLEAVPQSPDGSIYESNLGGEMTDTIESVLDGDRDGEKGSRGDGLGLSRGSTRVHEGDAEGEGSSLDKKIPRSPTIHPSSLPSEHERPRRVGRRTSKTVLSRLSRQIGSFTLSLLTPPTISLLFAILISLITPLKALFILNPSYTSIHLAPDGQPPLSVILDTATFIGNASVPLGLLVLGSSMARMKIPRPISKLPLWSIATLALAKMVFLPILGVLFVEGLSRSGSGLVDEGNKVLRFILIYFSCVPTATTQVALTQIFAPEDGESNADILAAYLLFQYVVFAFSSTILTAYTLSILF